ncbi:hypothetical protein P43SY_005980 [Pythium insidiosum]|uniref:WD40 repeat-like protein n=1 Tax=Pythium insidiosum TaxID=114742 RepID=A0AAD5Q4V3_PYTIN|nr:hypothetical protein P43SY_005980 [Pythium insidiosum]
MNPHEMEEPIQDEDVEIITADEVTEEYDIGDAPQGQFSQRERPQRARIPDKTMLRWLQTTMPMMAWVTPPKWTSLKKSIVMNLSCGPVYSIKVHPSDPRIVVSGGGDDVGVIWNREDGSVLHRLEGHTDTVASVDFSFDGKYAATGGFDGIVKVWEVATGKLVQTLEGPSEEVEWVTWHQKGNVVLAGSGDGTVWMWLASTGECMQVFAGHEMGVTCGSFTGSGKMIATGSSDQTVRLWNPKTGECTHVFRGHDFFEGPVTFLACHPSWWFLLNDELGGYRMPRWIAANLGFVDVSVTKLLWHPSQPIVYTSTVDGRIYVWDARNGQLIRSMSGHTDVVLDMAFVMDQGSATPIGLLTGSDDESVRLFPVAE